MSQKSSDKYKGRGDTRQLFRCPYGNEEVGNSLSAKRLGVEFVAVFTKGQPFSLPAIHRLGGQLPLTPLLCYVGSSLVNAFGILNNQ